ncbi:transporter substrate-binding domain-containing protein [Vibrio makurazakiensis]|uniref:substrate-binding periplasmic protein n=1 Tax=Vibrio makurazakiensis TaxID=2910250 RepID=UPI003D10D656
MAQQELLVVRGDGNWAPYEMTIDGKLTGFHVETIREVAEVMNLKLTIKTVPWVRALKMVKQGEADAITFLAKTEERESYIFYAEENILSSVEHYLIKHKSSHSISFNGDLESLRTYSIAYNQGFTFGEAFEKASYLKKTTTQNTEQVVNLVIKGRSDLGIIKFRDLKEEWISDKVNQFSIMEPVFHSKYTYIGFSLSSKNKDLKVEFTRAMKEFKASPRYQMLKRKYDL